MGKYSTLFLGHDTASTLIEAMPNTEEVRNDLETLEAYVKELRGRGRS